MSIAVAATDCQDELIRRRDGIVKSLYSFPSVASSGSRQEEKEKQLQQHQTAAGRPGKEGSIVVNARDVDAACSQKSFLEEEADKLQHAIDDDVRRIKKILDNKKEEGSLFELLRCLQSMKLSVSTLVATGIENSVHSVERHGSARVRQLARAVLDDWAKLSSNSSNINIGAANPWDNLWPKFSPLNEGALRAINRHPLDLNKLFSENSRESHKSMKDNVKRAAEARNEERKQENDCENLKPNCAQDSTSGKRKCEDAIDQSEPMSRSVEPHKTPSKRIKIIITSFGKELKKLAETTKKDNCELANESSSTITKKTPHQYPIDNFLIEEKVEASRMRIREGYNRAKEAKQQRRIQILDLRDIPKPVDSIKSPKSKARRGCGFSNRWRR